MVPPPGLGQPDGGETRRDTTVAYITTEAEEKWQRVNYEFFERHQLQVNHYPLQDEIDETWKQNQMCWVAMPNTATDKLPAFLSDACDKPLCVVQPLPGTSRMMRSVLRDRCWAFKAKMKSEVALYDVTLSRHNGNLLKEFIVMSNVPLMCKNYVVGHRHMHSHLQGRLMQQVVRHLEERGVLTSREKGKLYGVAPLRGTSQGTAMCGKEMT